MKGKCHFTKIKLPKLASPTHIAVTRVVVQRYECRLQSTGEKKFVRERLFPVACFGNTPFALSKKVVFSSTRTKKSEK